MIELKTPSDRDILRTLMGDDRYERELRLYVVHLHQADPGSDEAQKIEDRFAAAAVDVIEEMIDGCGFGDETITKYENELRKEGIEAPCSTLEATLTHMYERADGPPDGPPERS